MPVDLSAVHVFHGILCIVRVSKVYVTVAFVERRVIPCVIHGEVNTLDGAIDREYLHKMILVDVPCEPADMYPGGAGCGAALLTPALG